MPIPTFIMNAKLTCDLDADTATLRRERDMLTACAQQQAEAHRMLQAAQASLASVSGMPNRREIVAAAAERYLACNNALSAFFNIMFEFLDAMLYFLDRLFVFVDFPS